MESDGGGGAFLPLGDFLTAEDPVWVWDAATRRILWANQAGRDFWGAASVDALRARRFSARSKAVRRMKALASEADASREWVETLPLAPGPGRETVRCHIQSLQVAGGHPGLLVKALDQPGSRGEEAEPRGFVEPKAAGGRSRSDRNALDAIAARLRDRPGPQKPPQPVSTEVFDGAALTIRELCHELRNPLTVILGFAERVRDVAPPGRSQEKLREYAADIMESAQLAMAILSDFSARMLHPEDGAARPQPVDIKTTLESCIRLIAPLARDAGLKVTRSASGNLPPLHAGERALKQMLLNVLMNAVRHQKTGGRIQVTARRRKDGSVRLAIADDGRGMTKKEIKHIMGASRRKAGTAQPAESLSGLGLPLVKRLVESAGGTLAIDSARGKGTTVEMLFPAAG